MSAEVAAAKAVVAVASDKRGRVAIATILCSVIMLFFLIDFMLFSVFTQNLK